MLLREVSNCSNFNRLTNMRYKKMARMVRFYLTIFSFKILLIAEATLLFAQVDPTKALIWEMGRSNRSGGKQRPYDHDQLREGKR